MVRSQANLWQHSKADPAKNREFVSTSSGNSFTNRVEFFDDSFTNSLTVLCVLCGHKCVLCVHKCGCVPFEKETVKGTVIVVRKRQQYLHQS